MTDLTTLAVLGVAGIVAGAVNAVAGGGTFFTFPVLIWAGLPPLVANTTNMVALLPANAAALRPQRDMLKALGPGLALPIIAGCIGGFSGALLLLWLGDELFASAVPYLIGAATFLFAVAPSIRRWVERLKIAPSKNSRIAPAITIFFFAIYGGYFGAGLGQVMLAALILCGFQDLREANVLKNVVVTSITIFAVLVFVWTGTVAWVFALVMMVGASVGGYLGGIVSVSAPQTLIRRGIIAFGCFLTLYYFTFGT